MPNIVPEDVEKDNKQMLGLANKLHGYFKDKEGMGYPADIAQNIARDLDLFKKQIPVIKVICTSGMQDRHWEAIAEEIGYSNFKIDETTQYKRTLDYPLLEHLHRLEEISESANKEYGNLRLLDKMSSEWEGVAFEAKDWAESATYILSGAPVEEVQTILDDHILKT